MIKRFSFYSIVLLSGLLSSCDSNESSISPQITVLSLGSNDTLKVRQRFHSLINVSFKDDIGLANYHIRINDSIFDPIALTGNSFQYQLDTIFRNAGLYKFTIFATNLKGLESTYYIPILCDSIKPPQIIVNSMADTIFKSDSSVFAGQTLEFLLVVKRGKLPLDSIRITNTINSQPFLTKADNIDSVKIIYKSPPILSESIFSFSAIDSVGLESKRQIKVQIKK